MLQGLSELLCHMLTPINYLKIDLINKHVGIFLFKKHYLRGRKKQSPDLLVPCPDAHSGLRRGQSQSQSAGMEVACVEQVSGI